MVRAEMTSRLQLYLGLARASNLPTVWTNALAAWALMGRTIDPIPLLLICLAGSLLYAGGCTLNDAFDAAWDRERRPERPIPSGALSEREVWIVGSVELIGGLAILASFGMRTLGSGALVVLAILLYDWLHKKTAWSVLLMGWCRLQWVLTAATTAVVKTEWIDEEIWNPPLIYGSILLAYIVYVSLMARRESLTTPETKANSAAISNIISILLFAALGWLLCALLLGTFIPLIPVTALAIWFLLAKGIMDRGGRPKIGIFVSRALAGIVLLDTAFACLSWHWWGLCLAGFLPVCLLLQRRIAAT